MVRTFSYFGDWRNQELGCSCGWSGPLREEQTEPHESLLDFSCPECDACLAVVPYPTDEETREMLPDLSKSERDSFALRERFLENAERRALRHPEQLPDLVGDALTLEWDLISERGSHDTVIHHEGTVLWREPAQWEGARRFEEIAAIAKARYGERLRDLVPSRRSRAYLYGDALLAQDEVEQIRHRLRG